MPLLQMPQFEEEAGAGENRGAGVGGGERGPNAVEADDD
jgi:hypothetical protein